MAFQTYQSESTHMPLLEELKGETVLSLAQRSPKQLSDLCTARGLDTQGSVHEVAARLVDWKKAVGHGPAPATPRLRDFESESQEVPSLDPRSFWPEDEESVIGLGHLNLGSPSLLMAMNQGLAKNSELTTPSSTPSTSYHSIVANMDSHSDTQVEETFDFSKFQSPHAKRGASPHRTPPANPNVAVYPRPPNNNIPPLPHHPAGFPRRDPSELYFNRSPPIVNQPNVNPFPKTPHPAPNMKYSDFNAGHISPVNNQFSHQPSHPNLPRNYQPNHPNYPVNQQPSQIRPIQHEPTGQVLFQSLLGGPPDESIFPPVLVALSEPETLVLPNPAPGMILTESSFVGITEASDFDPVSVATDWANTPEPSPKAKQYDPTKMLAKDQLEDFLLRGPGQELVQVQFSDLVFGKKLGSGGYKECYAGTYKGDPVAIGELKVTEFTPADFQEIKNEIDVLKQMWHENVVRFIGVTKGPSKLSIVTELCHRGDLYDHMRKTPKPPLQRQLGLMHDISLGVAYLHTRRPSIIHRDLKSMNILLNDEYKAKINDFGLARIRTRVRSLAHTQCGTPNWQAPEIWAKKPSYTEKVDVYAVGLIFWEIMQWSVEPYPYWNIPENDLVSVVGGQKLRPSLENLVGYPQELIDLVVRMWDHDPLKRPSMGVVIEELAQYLD